MHQWGVRLARPALQGDKKTVTGVQPLPPRLPEAPWPARGPLHGSAFGPPLRGGSLEGTVRVLTGRTLLPAEHLGLSTEDALELSEPRDPRAREFGWAPIPASSPASLEPPPRHSEGPEGAVRGPSQSGRHQEPWCISRPRASLSVFQCSEKCTVLTPGRTDMAVVCVSCCT